MVRVKIIFMLCLIVFNTAVYARVKIRLFSSLSPESAVFSVTGGRYSISGFTGDTLNVAAGEPVLFSRYKGKLVVKKRNDTGFVCDSLIFEGETGSDTFYLRTNGKSDVRHYYSGDLKCYPDLGTLLMINICDVEEYIAGVVKAEGGSGRNKEYIKTQAVIARTYMYKYFDKHAPDKYNVCDDTHCQAFNGLSSDSIINAAALETRGLVILSNDKTLAVSAFHSNCGGETASSEDVWLTSLPYLKRVVDPYCISSRNSKWEKNLSMDDWISLLKKWGYKGKTDDPAVFTFSQISRQTDYKTGSFKLPLRTIRMEMNLRSTFFNVFTDGVSITLKGRGYGHGVGLCQEGAMVMANKGSNYHQIIDFYYFGVLIDDIKNAVVLPDAQTTVIPNGNL